MRRRTPPWTGFSESAGNREPVSDLSWVGDSTVGFAVTYSPEVREQVRTLDVSNTGTNLLADSRLVWSQPTRPRLIGSVQEPPDVSNFNGSIAVEWANPSGTGVIGSWNTGSGLD